MRSKIRTLSAFANHPITTSQCFRPETGVELSNAAQHPNILVRGNGLSYSDCCLNDQGTIIDDTRLRHFLAFDAQTGIVVAEAGVTINELFLVHPDFIPRVIPGTVYATIGGCLANDVHGKNNPQAGTFGHSVVWFDLLINKKQYRCSRRKNSELFYATIGGLGLTGIIERIAINLVKRERGLTVQTKKYYAINELLQAMRHTLSIDYQVAWLDLLTAQPVALLKTAVYSNVVEEEKKAIQLPIPRIRLINNTSIKMANRMYFKSHKETITKHNLLHYNNPLDRVSHWKNLYGELGLIQFQAVFPVGISGLMIEKIITIIREQKALPTLCVLKFFSQPGSGLLSFAESGFTIAIDFLRNNGALAAVPLLNKLVTVSGGKVYLAKDQLLTAEQCTEQYSQLLDFKKVLTRYKSPMQSNLARRLGIING